MRWVLVAFSVVGLLFLFIQTEWTIVESAQVLTGLLALWLPFGALVFLVSAAAFADNLSRFTFSAIASYALTSLAWLLFSAADLWLPGVRVLFYVALVLSFGGALLYVFAGWRRTGGALPAWPGGVASVDWCLVALLVATLLVTARYKRAFEFDPVNRTYSLVAHGDQTSYAGMALELARQTPPRQWATRAGVPERPYHLLPHVTTMLVGRFTGQTDMMRVQLVYVYTVIDVLLCLATCCLARLLTGVHAAGYLAVVLLLLAAVPFPCLAGVDAQESQYFTLWPHATSTVEPTVYSSPQMYAGILVTYGVFLGSACLSPARRTGAPGFVLVLAAMVGSLERFRIQVFLPLFPAFALMLLLLYWRTRQRRFLCAGALALAIAFALWLEMRSSVYLPGTSTLVIENTGMAFKNRMVNSWPGMTWVHEQLVPLRSSDPTLYAWLWQLISLPMYVAANVIGIPLLLALAYYLCRPAPWREFPLLNGLLVWLVVASVAGALCISTTYDSYSLGSQMLWHTGWYLAVWMGPALWLVWQRVQPRWRQHEQEWATIGLILALLVLVWQLCRPPSAQEQELRVRGITLTQDDWAALQCIRGLPQDAVTLVNYFQGPKDLLRRKCGLNGVFSGVGGRSTYLEYVPLPIADHFWPDEVYTDRYRMQRIADVWNARGGADFRRALPSVVTHVVEYSHGPLADHPPSCLRQVWVSPNQQIAIWVVVPPEP